MSAPFVPVTGETITDEQILEAYDARIIDCDTGLHALWTSPGWGRREAARERCAAAYNARHGGKS